MPIVNLAHLLSYWRAHFGLEYQRNIKVCAQNQPGSMPAISKGDKFNRVQLAADAHAAPAAAS
jgi:hypothetical protein